MKKLTTRILLLGAMLAAGPVWAVNKCTGSYGQTIYQEAPCAGSGITVAEDVARKQAAVVQKQVEDDQAVAAQKAKQDADREAMRADIQKKVQAAMEKNDTVIAKAKAACTGGFSDYPTIGMAEQKFQNCTTWGLLNRADSVNQTETASGVSKQFVYPSGREIRYLYTVNGRVTAIQR